MTKRSHQSINTKKQPISTAPAQGMFQSRSLKGRSDSTAESQQPDPKTSLMQAEHYGHHLGQIQATGVSVPTVVQPKTETGQPIQLAKGKGGILKKLKNFFKLSRVTKSKKTSSNPSHDHKNMLTGSERTATNMDRWRQVAREEGRRRREPARREGEAVRNQVRVSTAAPGITHTQIQRPDNPQMNMVGGTPGAIMNHISPGDRYDRLRVRRGARTGGVQGTRPGEAQQPPSGLASHLPHGTAVINGGYFAMSRRDNQGNLIPGRRGQPVGPTSHRPDHHPIGHPWLGDYGAVTVGGQVGVSSGPVLSGNRPPFRGQERFSHRLQGPDGQERPNPLNSQPGALTHASDKNPRAAISTMQHHPTGEGDVIMHTLTTGGVRGNRGATMDEWSNITRMGAARRHGDVGNPATLNLDGGGSVYMGVTRPQGPTRIARGSQPSRPVANIIYSDPRGRRGNRMNIIPELP